MVDKQTKYLSRSLACGMCDGPVHESGDDAGYSIVEHSKSLGRDLVVGHVCKGCGDKLKTEEN